MKTTNSAIYGGGSMYADSSALGALNQSGSKYHCPILPDAGINRL